MKLPVIKLLFVFCLLTANAIVSAEQVNVYSGRQEALIKPLLDKFTQQTGIEVNLVTGKADALIQRAISEGEFSPVDVLIMADAGRLYRAKSLQLTQPMTIDLTAVPTHFVDADRHWVALTKRARSIMVTKDVAKSSGEDGLPQTIQALAENRFKGKVCVRSSDNIYNQSMIAAMLLRQGEQATLDWAQGIVANMARSPKGGDRDQIRAMVAGECEFAIANTYYLGGMLTSEDAQERAVAEQVQMLWTPASAGGTHINISGAAIARYAPNKSQAEQLIQFMLAPSQQQWYAEVNQEYPLLDSVAWSEVLQAFGTFDAEQVDFNQMGKLNAEALMIMDKAGWR